MKNGKIIINVAVIVCLGYVFFQLAEAFPTPSHGGLRYVIIHSAKDCIWNGYDGLSIRPKEIDKPVEKLQRSLLDYTPMLKFNIVEIDRLSDSCNLIYRPQGLPEKDWILLVRRGNSNSQVLALYYDKTIREISDLNLTSEIISECKFYHEAQDW